MADLRTLLLVGVIPGAIALLVLAGAWSLWTRSLRRPPASGGEAEERKGVGPLWAGALAFALGVPVADWAVIPGFRLWPADVTYRYPHIAGAALLGGLLACLFGGRGLGVGLARGVVRGVTIGFAVWAILEGLHPHALGTGALWLWTIGAGAAGAAVLEVQDAALLRARGALGGVHLLVIAAGLPPTLFLGTLAGGATVSGVLVAAASGALLAGLLSPRLSLARGATTVFLTVVTALAATGAALADLPVPAAILLFLAPTASAVVLIPGLGGRSAWVRAAALAGATGIVVAAGAGWAFADHRARHAGSADESGADEYGDYYGY